MCGQLMAALRSKRKRAAFQVIGATASMFFAMTTSSGPRACRLAVDSFCQGTRADFHDNMLTKVRNSCRWGLPNIVYGSPAQSRSRGEACRSDFSDLCLGTANLAQDLGTVLAETRWRQPEAVTGGAGERDRDRHRQHLPLRGVFDLLEEASLSEIGVGEQTLEVGDDAIRDIKRVEPLAPFGGSAPVHPLDDDLQKRADIVGAARQCRETLVIGQFGAVDGLQ